MTGPHAPEPAAVTAGRTAESAVPTAIPAGLRDAQNVAARVSADEAAADAERARLARESLPILDDQIEERIHLRTDESLHATRPAALLEERNAALPSGGTLYLTSHRLVHAGTEVREVALGDITETAVALERLLLVDLADGSDLAIEVDRPRLLRVQLAAARAVARGRG